MRVRTKIVVVLAVILILIAIFTVTTQSVPRKFRSTRPRIILTFDDSSQGWSDDKSVGIMTKFGYKGVSLLVVRHFEWMEKDVFRKLVKKGWEIGSHSWNHLDLNTLTYEVKYHEIIDSKSWIEDNFNTKVVLFSYPFSEGATNPDVLDLLRKGGYIYAREFDRFQSWNGEPSYQINSFLICPENYVDMIQTVISEARKNGIAVVMFHRINAGNIGYCSLTPEAFRYCLQQIKMNSIEVTTFKNL